ncbi:HipA domain-containing protein [Microbacterium sp. XT11]|uniref:HipA domain-containing protein n=1 Tax=Microbacterium sp. XT11 TaxID=367477 RepID=UPI000742DA6F|nr:HipA domain-containing protein [Microbacterium sp. XT11]ALX66062.1 HipA domain-containing protein [Microbacterium sp. XT11]
MNERLAVFLDGRRIGTLAQTQQGSVTFSYMPDYWGNRGVTPLSLSLPLVVPNHKNRPTRAFLQGLLPDSAARLEELGREFGVSPRNPFALLAHMGSDAAGAVQILPEGDDSSDAAVRQGDVSELDESEFAAIVADVIANRDTWGRRDNASVRWSLPGAQPKVALFRTDEGRWAIPNDSTPTTHIIKPAVPPYSDHHINEFMTMAAARWLGLDVADDFVVTTERGDHAFVSVRYDRRKTGERWERLHQEDLCQAMSIPPEKKYQAEGGPGIATIAQLFASLPHHEDRRLNARRFFDAIVFNVAALGTDAHAKNYSLLLSADRATLAPLYDLGSHTPYPIRGSGLPRLAMSVEGEYRATGITPIALARAGRRLGLDEGEAHDRAVSILRRVVEAYRVAAELARDALGDHEFIDRMLQGIGEYTAQRSM